MILDHDDRWLLITTICNCFSRRADLNQMPYLSYVLRVFSEKRKCSYGFARMVESVFIYFVTVKCNEILLHVFFQS